MKYGFIQNSFKDSYVAYDLVGIHLIIINDSDPLGNNYSLEFSFSGLNKEGELKAGESLELKDLNAQRIAIRAVTAGDNDNFRVFSFGENIVELSNNDYNKPLEYVLIKPKNKSPFDN